MLLIEVLGKFKYRSLRIRKPTVAYSRREANTMKKQTPNITEVLLATTIITEKFTEKDI